MNAAISVDDLIEYAKSHQEKYVALIDIDTMYGTIEFYQKAIANNLEPVIGLQIDYQGKRYCLIAKNFNGLSNLYKISSFVCTKVDFKLNEYLKDVFVIGMSDVIIPEISSVCEKFYTLAKNNPIAAKENYCINKDDLVILETIRAIKDEINLDQVKKNTNDIYFMSEATAKTTYSPEALDNLDKLLQSINLRIDLHQKINFVKYAEQDSQQLLHELAFNGLKKRVATTPIYEERLNMELAVINQMNFNDYFLVVQDYVN
jgi:DNA polymerase-3 subunit alpha